MIGEDGLPLDRFTLTMGFRKVAQQTWDEGLLDSNHKSYLQAYADGINAFIAGMKESFHSSSSTAWLLPPEFYAVGITDASQIEPWHPVDSLVILKVTNFGLSYNWNTDLLKDIIGSLNDGELKSIVGDMLGYRYD